MHKYLSFLSVVLIMLMSCSNSNDNINVVQSDTINDVDNNDSDNNDHSDSTEDTVDYQEWLVPINEIKDGGPGKDGIPSIDFPIFIEADHFEAGYVNDEDLIMGLIRGDEVRAYPHKILDYHEIINDEIGGIPVSINYCPLTGTGFAWKGELNIADSSYGVSGLLYNSNLILYDRNTDSNWSQLKLQCINGPLIQEIPETYSVIETNWATWKNMFPETLVLSKFTGYNRDYNFYPYGDYKTNHDLFLFSVNPTNNALPSKERVYSIIEGDLSKVYRFSDFVQGKALIDVVNGNTYLVVGNDLLIKSFKINGVYQNLNFEYSYSGGSEFFSDDEGNVWNIDGLALSGPKSGQKLSSSKDVVSYWFAIAAFYPNPDIYLN